ncbi:MAG: glucuronate isomerase [Gemmatimonadaceae bacterium]|nr:glucuronate isomerase [Gemmatimonadaceae bacterium]
MKLNEDRFFDPDPATRRVARDLYDTTRELPIISPHGHVDPAILATNAPFPEPTALLVSPDHYILRLLHSQGIPLEALGIPTRDGKPVTADPRTIWRLFAKNWFLFRGTPSRAWLDYELHEVFGVTRSLSADTAEKIYDEIAEKLGSPEFTPRRLFDRFRIEVLATTDRATDTLEHHRAIRESEWKRRVIPTFRPDALFAIASPQWRGQLSLLEEVAHNPVKTFEDFRSALAGRRKYFKTMGATASDHAVEVPHTERLPDREVEKIFRAALDGAVEKRDQARFEAHMLMEMAEMSLADGLVMQLHPGAFRDHDAKLYDRFGSDRGGDIPAATEYTRNLRDLLNAYGNDPRLTLIVFTLDESTYSRELAPLAGYYSAMKLGPPWWFHDSIEGMHRFRARTTETAGLYNTVGFNDDTRAFCSIPARHDLSRRVDANFLASLVVRHIVAKDEAVEMARSLAYELARDSYKLGTA